MPELNIRVGIKTAGAPELIQGENYVVLRNMLIGDSFHWQQSTEVRLPADATFEEVDRDGSLAYGEADSKVSLVMTLPVESYLMSVVASEMNSSAPVEFLKAHAVISRSWVIGKIVGTHPIDGNGKVDEADRLIGWDDTSGHKGFHVCSDDHCQRYQGVKKLAPSILDALKMTEGEVLTTPRGEILDARFSKCCGGITEVFETCWQPKHFDCLESVEDPWCNLENLDENKRRVILSTILNEYDLKTEGYGYRWSSEILKSAVQDNLLHKFNRDIGRIEGMTALHRGPSGRIDLLRLDGEKGSLEIGKELWIRRLLSDSHLYSSYFEIEDTGKSFILRGRGWGHGVGLCQIGAANMALHGYGYRDILKFYYPGSRVEKWA